MKNEIMKKVMNAVSMKAGRAGLLLKKRSPEILMGFGVATFVGTVALACRSTLRAEEVLDFHKEKMKEIHEAKEIAEQDPQNELEYNEHLYRQDVGLQYLKTSVNMVRLYAAPLSLGVVSLGCFLTSFKIMKGRYLGVVACYEGLKTIHDTYRQRVREEYGEELDQHFRYGTEYTMEKETVVDENGKKKTEKIKVANTDQNALKTPEDTSRFFDSSNRNWDRNPEFSMMFLRAQERYLNDLLQTRGHVFLNEVYEALGFDHTSKGAILGWVAGEGDDWIHFGLNNQHRENVRRFVNGDENSILLEFNPQGVIYDKI